MSTIRLVLLVLLLTGTAQAASRKVEVVGVVNLNAATEEQLMGLPGVGMKKAQRIIVQRQKRKFRSIDELMQVKGFGRVTYRRLKPHLTISGSTTLASAPPIRTPAVPPPPAPK